MVEKNVADVINVNIDIPVDADYIVTKKALRLFAQQKVTMPLPAMQAKKALPSPHCRPIGLFDYVVTKKALPRIELGFSDSKSDVLTIGL